jgi:hypothetical protein
MLVIEKSSDADVTRVELHNVDERGQYRHDDPVVPVQTVTVPKSWVQHDQVVARLIAATTVKPPEVMWGDWQPRLQEFLELLTLMLYSAFGSYRFYADDFVIASTGLHLRWTCDPGRDDLNDVCYFMEKLIDEDRFHRLTWAFPSLVYHRWRIRKDHAEDFWLHLPWERSAIGQRLRAELIDKGPANMQFLNEGSTC